MAKALTSRTVQSVKTTDERREIPDGLLRGLYLIVQPSGARSWAVRYRHNGSTRKHTLGNYPALDLAQAREAGAKALRTVAEGRDPGAEKQEARSDQPDTVGAVVANFLENHVKRNNRPRTGEETVRLFKLHVLPHWYDVDDVASLQRLHAEMFDSGPAIGCDAPAPHTARHTAALLNELWPDGVFGRRTKPRVALADTGLPHRVAI